MHRYYVHVLRSLLAHQSTYAGVYRIRHPLPPYLTQYAVLMFLFRFLPQDLGEQIFTCIVLFCFAYGLRFAAKQLGPRGGWITLPVAPLLLGWPLMMGFFNYVLALGLLFFTIGFWSRIRRTGFRSLIPFVLFLALLTVTHPVPLLLLIVLCALDLALLLLLAHAHSSFAARMRGHAALLIGFACTLVAAAVPMLAVDPGRTGNTLRSISFHPEFVTTSLVLSGVSPYNTRSLSVSIDAYRLTLYIMFLAAFCMGARACYANLRRRSADYSVTIFIATVFLLAALPFTPNGVNGSHFFATRLVFALWPAAVLAASAAPPQPCDTGHGGWSAPPSTAS